MGKIRDKIKSEISALKDLQVTTLNGYRKKATEIEGYWGIIHDFKQYS